MDSKPEYIPLSLAKSLVEQYLGPKASAHFESFFATEEPSEIERSLVSMLSQLLGQEKAQQIIEQHKGS